jgi:hypothetical protein
MRSKPLLSHKTKYLLPYGGRNKKNKNKMTNINLITYNKWTDYYYALPHKIITNNQIDKAIFSLINYLNENNVSKDLTILIQFKIQIKNSQFRSISYLQSLKLFEMEELNDIFKAFWETKDEEYYSMNPEHIVFIYKIIEPLNKEETIKIKFNKIKSSLTGEKE